MAAPSSSSFTAMVFYICDREKCEHCNGDCHHTTDRLHARDQVHDFETSANGNMWERPKPWDDWELEE